MIKRGPHIVTDGLFFYIDAANLKSYTSGSLITTNLRNFTITGSIDPTVLFFPNENNGCWAFRPPSNHKIEFNGSFINGLPQATISVWCRVNTFASSTQRNIAGKIRLAGAGTNELSISAFNNRFDFFCDEPSTFKQVVSTNNKVTGVWYNVCGVYDGSEISLHINGAEEGTRVSRTGNLISSTIPFTLGQESDSITYDFDGEISNVMVYNKGLTELEIQQNYNALKGRFG